MVFLFIINVCTRVAARPVLFLNDVNENIEFEDGTDLNEQRVQGLVHAFHRMKFIPESPSLLAKLEKPTVAKLTALAEKSIFFSKDPLHHSKSQNTAEIP